MALAARHGQGWITTGPGGGPWSERDAVEQWWDGVAESVARFSDVEEAVRAEQQGPTRPRLDRYITLDAAGPVTLSSVAALTDQVGRAADLGFTDVIVHWPRAASPYRADLAALEGYLASLAPSY